MRNIALKLASSTAVAMVAGSAAFGTGKPRAESLRDVAVKVLSAVREGDFPSVLPYVHEHECQTITPHP